MTIRNNQRLAHSSLVALLLLLLISCTEELSIADFADAFEDYEVELRIEGILDASDVANSIIRVDRTILVTDTSLFNGIDDNGDWESYTDLNGNGQWDEGEPLNDDIGVDEPGPPGQIPPGRGNGKPDPGEPHVDDYIEILPQIHDSTMSSVILREAESGDEVAQFVWSANAGRFDVIYGEGGPPEQMLMNPYTSYTYGAYVPDPSTITGELDTTLLYEVELTTQEGRVITATTDLVGPPVDINWEGATWEQDTLKSSKFNATFMTWQNSSDPPFCAVYMDQVLAPDTLKNFYGSMAVAFLDLSTFEEVFQGNFIGIPEGLYLLRMEAFNQSYGNYVYSGLPMRDRELSNWRDDKNNVVLGVLGSKNPIEFHMRLTP